MRLTFCFLHNTHAITDRVLASTCAALSAWLSGPGEVLVRLLAEAEGDRVALWCDPGAYSPGEWSAARPPGE